jgi:branched-chain amino acid transport system substrate-binding protein
MVEHRRTSSNVGTTRRGVLVGGAAAAVGLAMPAIARAAGKEVLIGCILPVSGPSASFGQNSWDGVQFALDVLNKKGGVKSLGGATLKAELLDTESKPQVAASQTEQMIRRGATVLLGCNQSAATIIATQIAERAQVPFVTAFDIDPAITARGFKYTFRTTPLASSFATDLVNYYKAMGDKAGKPIKRLGILSENSILGESANRYASAAAKKAGMDIVVQSYDVGQTQNFAPYVAKLKGADVQATVGHNRTSDGILIIRTMKDLRFNPVAVGGILGAPSDSQFISNLGADANGIFATDSWAPTLHIAGLKELTAAFQAKLHKKMDVGNATLFSDVVVIWDALERAKSTDHKAVRDALAATDLKTGEKGFLILRGCKFNAAGDNVLASSLVNQIQSGTPVPVWPGEVAQAQPVYPKPAWS